jgi:hypothetical protein
LTGNDALYEWTVYVYIVTASKNEEASEGEKDSKSLRCDTCAHFLEERKKEMKG